MRILTTAAVVDCPRGVCAGCGLEAVVAEDADGLILADDGTVRGYYSGEVIVNSPEDSGRLLCDACYNDRELAVETPRSSGDGSPEPFCSCGRRTSECDGSRRGCRKRAE